MLSRWYILSSTVATPILPKGSCFVQRVDGRAEERSNLIDNGTHVRYLYTNSIVSCGTVQL